MNLVTASAPAVSVVIPVKDDAAALRRCLRALAVQSSPPDEVIVVDNASSDDTAAVASAAGARIVRCETPGIPAAAAAGYDAARHPLILRLDADSIPGSTWVAAMRTRAAARPDAAALVGAARFADGPTALRTPLAIVYLGSYALVGSLTLGHLPLFGSNLGIRARAWRAARHRVHRESTRIHDDLDLAFHIGERHPIAFARDAAVGISMRPFGDGRGFVRRLRRGLSTVVIHWPADFPPVRWTKVAINRARLRHARRSRT